MSAISPDLPSASVIIRTRNEARHLPRLLDALLAQNHRPLELIVVDSGSTDKTVAIAREAGARIIEIAPEEFTFGRSLNRGCEVAAGEVLAIVSAHTYPASNNWLWNLAAPFSDPAVAMVYGRQLPDARTKLGEAREFAERYPPSSMVLLEEPFGNNANSAVRAALWAEHPFDEQLSGLEDIEWARHAQRRGHVVRYASNAAIVHIHEETPRQVYGRFFREGVAFAELFPDQPRHRTGATLKGIADLIRDVRYGRSVSASPRELIAVPVYRASSAVGFHSGVIARERQRASSSHRAVSYPTLNQRAVLVDGPAAHTVISQPPPSPLPGQVVIRVACVGVCATDVAIADGRQHYYASGRTSYPIVPGHEYAGVVESTGSVSDRHLVGTRVVGECLLGCGRCSACQAGAPSRCSSRAEVGVLHTDGAYATRVVVPASSVHRLPDRVPLLFGALVEPLAVVLKAVRKLDNLKGERAAVVGVGPIGHIVAQVLRHLGAQVTVIDPDEQRLVLLRHMDFSTATEISSRVLENVSAVVEAAGTEGVVSSLAEASSVGTRIVLLGAPGEDGEIVRVPGAPDEAPELVASLGSDPQDWPMAIRMIAGGRLDLRPLTADVAPIEEYASAWDSVRTRARLKTILVVDPVLARE